MLKFVDPLVDAENLQRVIAMLCDTLTRELELTPDDPELQSEKGLYGVNLWPEGQLQFRQTMLDYSKEMLKLGRHLFGAFALALGLEEDYFAPMITKPTMALRTTVTWTGKVTTRAWKASHLCWR